MSSCNELYNSVYSTLCVMGNLGKPINFPFVWAHKGRRNLDGVYGIVPRGLLAERTLNHCSQNTACIVARSFWCL